MFFVLLALNGRFSCSTITEIMLNLVINACDYGNKITEYYYTLAITLASKFEPFKTEEESGIFAAAYS